MTTESEPILLDTNVLIYALDEDSPHHNLSRAIMQRAAMGEGSYCVSSQVLAEFSPLSRAPGV